MILATAVAIGALFTTGTYLLLDDAVHGLGSAACGPEVAPEHRLWPGARAFGVVFEDPREP